MKKIIATTLSLLLTGCIGATVSNVSNNSYQYTEKDRSHITKQAPIQDGKVRISEEKKWCGATIWAVIIPVPLMLPSCSAFREESYAEGKLVSATVQTVSYPMYACGPIMWMASISHGYKGNAFCAKW